MKYWHNHRGISRLEILLTAGLLILLMLITYGIVHTGLRAQSRMGENHQTQTQLNQSMDTVEGLIRANDQLDQVQVMPNPWGEGEVLAIRRLEDHGEMVDWIIADDHQLYYVSAPKYQVPMKANGQTIGQVDVFRATTDGQVLTIYLMTQQGHETVEVQRDYYLRSRR